MSPPPCRNAPDNDDFLRPSPAKDFDLQVAAGAAGDLVLLTLDLVARRPELGFDVVSGLSQLVGTVQHVPLANLDRKPGNVSAKLVGKRYEVVVGRRQFALMICSRHPNHGPPSRASNQKEKAEYCAKSPEQSMFSFAFDDSAAGVFVAVVHGPCLLLRVVFPQPFLSKSPNPANRQQQPCHDECRPANWDYVNKEPDSCGQPRIQETREQDDADQHGPTGEIE